MRGRPRRARQWAEDHLRGFVDIATRNAVGDLHGQGDRAILQLSTLAADLADLRRDLAAQSATADERARAQRDEIRSLSQSLKYLAFSTISDRREAAQPDLSPYEMRVFSQNGEDGVLLEILRRIGSESQRFVEIGARAAEANCVILAVLLGWEGTFVDADHVRTEELRRSHGAHGRIDVIEAFVTRDNVDELVGREPLDVLSLDIDGNDYWVWQAMDGIMPRVVIIEYNAALDPSKALVQPYDPQWVWQEDNAFGASREAMVRLGTAKGYRLVHAESTGANLFFVRADVAGDSFLPAEQVSVRTPNYLLAAESHPDAADRLEYVDLDGPLRGGDRCHDC